MCELFILFIAIIIAYGVGAIPTGYWLSRCFAGVDITKHGSGNCGATNVARVLGKKFFPVVFTLDAGKAFLCLYLLGQVCGGPAHNLILYSLAGCLLVGNAYSPFMGFKGGKGVATAAGIVAYFLPWYFLVMFCCLWLLLLAFVPVSFVASLGTAAVTVLFVFLYWPMHIWFFVFVFCWLCWRHRPNIYAWLNGNNIKGRDEI